MSSLMRSAIKLSNFTEPFIINTEYDINPSYGIIFRIIQVIFIISLIVCMRRGHRNQQQEAHNVDYHIAAIIHR